jgi:hypothetical protein
MGYALWFLVVLFIYYWLFWKILTLILILPVMAASPVLSWATSEPPNALKKVTKIPVFIVARFFGSEAHTLTYGVSIGIIVSWFVTDPRIVHSWAPFYYVVGGIMAATMTAPSGEGNNLGRVEALLGFVVTAWLTT